MTYFSFVNGHLVPEKEASLPLDDVSITRGYAVFATMRSYDGEPFWWERHIERIISSSTKLGFQLSFTKEDFYAILKTLLEKNQIQDAVLKIIVTGGSSSSLSLEGPAGIAVTCLPFRPLPIDFYQKGVKLSTLPHERIMPEVKSTHYFSALREKTLKKEIFEVLYISHKQEVLEASTSNFFGVKNNTVITPSTNILCGVTRGIILSLAAPYYPCQIRPVYQKELEEMDEVFLTATNKDILPVSSIDSIQYEVGPVTKHLQKIFQEYVQKKEWIHKLPICQNVF